MKQQAGSRSILLERVRLRTGERNGQRRGWRCPAPSSPERVEPPERVLSEQVRSVNLAGLDLSDEAEDLCAGLEIGASPVTAARIGIRVNLDPLIDQVHDPVDRYSPLCVSGELLASIPIQAGIRNLHDQSDVGGAWMPVAIVFDSAVSHRQVGLGFIEAWNPDGLFLANVPTGGKRLG